MQTWRERVRAGDFAAIRTDLDFKNSVALAHLIDGYELTGGFVRRGEILCRTLERCPETDRSHASALDLWVAIFYAHRGYRHAGTWPEGAELMALDQLAAELRAALLALTPCKKVGIMTAMRDPSVLEGREARCG